MKKILLSAWRLIASGFVAVCISYFMALVKVSAVIGSGKFCFSLIHAFIPLIGIFAGLGTTLFYMITKMVLHYGIFDMFSCAWLAFCGFASLCASLYWTHPTIMTRCMMPLLCIILFVLHPVGGAAWLYSCYWLIPIAIYWTEKKSVFLDCIATTFIQHAVGSVLMVYGGSLSAAVWLSLIPFVICERLLLAFAMMGMYYMGMLAAKKISQIKIGGQFLDVLGKNSVKKCNV
ncbi:MAG TPA: hypothetical protein VEK38_00690 [Candidatus Bathyarchaeia archaeon]|nr:hypothetical protein [Candidatus Bathyarchaeia archaeon]